MTKTIHTETHINASANCIWHVLTEIDKYPAWNPFIIEAKGDVAIGRDLKITLQSSPKSKMSFSPRIIKYRPNKELQWIGKLLLPRIFDGIHKFEIKENPDGSCTFIQSEVFKGVIVRFFNTEDTEQGFNAMNKAIKQRAEDLMKQQKYAS